MLVFSYRTIVAPAEGIYKEKGSKFLAFAYPVESEEEVKVALDSLRKTYFDARHHCYAYMLGAERTRFRASDDGEPNHSAGDPILGQIRSKSLTNVLVVVVRYFGGVKLGVGGLITAYKTAAEEALNNAVCIEKEVTEKLSIVYPYASTPEVMRLVKEFELVIVSQSFTDQSLLEIEYRIKHKVMLFEKIALLQALGHPMTVTVL